MIVLWGVAEDSPLGAVWRALARRGAEIFFLDQRRTDEARLEFGLDGRGGVRQGAESCDLARVEAVYVRGGASETLTPGAADDPARLRHLRALDAAFAAWLEVTPARIVNPLEAMASNSSKPYQLGLIREHGFLTPDTLVTTDPAAVRAFQVKHGALIYKSVSGVRSIVSRFDPADADRLADIVWCPTQFQQYVAGRDYRVHVIGEAVFASEIVSDADDYRYAGAQGRDVAVAACVLPDAVEAQCRALVASLGLVAAGVDLRRTPEGSWFCFEVNPSPAFTYYEAETGQPLADAMAALLAGDSGRPRRERPPRVR